MPRPQGISLLYPEPPPPDFAKLELVEAFGKLLDTGKGSDLTITCNGTTFRVHKVILASRSGFFAATCWGGFKEAESNTIDLPDDDPGLVKKMIEYLYVLDYEVDKDTNVDIDKRDFLGAASRAPDLNANHIGDFPTRFKTPRMERVLPPHGLRTCWEALQEALQQQTHDFDDTMDLLAKQKTPLGIASLQHGKERLIPASELAIHASLYSLADKYGIQGLKSTCVQKMTAALQGIGWEKVWLFHSPQAKMEEFAAAVAIAWATTPESDKGLRTVILDYTLKHVKGLLRINGIEEFFEKVPQFGIDLLARITQGANEDPIRTPPWQQLEPPGFASEIGSQSQQRLKSDSAFL